MNNVVLNILCLGIMGVLTSQLQAEPSGTKTIDTVTSEDTQTFDLWENGAPGALGHDLSDIPALTYYPALRGHEVPTAVIVAPGGGYGMLAMNHEGRQVASWLNAMGIPAFVLRYRLGPRYHHPIELGDAQRAIRLVRTRAAEFGVKPDRIGMMGFSAGGHLTSSAETHFDAGNPDAADPIDRASSRPDFAVLGYPVVTMQPPYVHVGSLHNLLGESPDPARVQLMSNELQVSSQTPPTFIWTTSEDTTVPPENSVLFYLAMLKAKVPGELHVFQKGAHGLGLDLGDPALGEWSRLLVNWFRSVGLL